MTSSTAQRAPARLRIAFAVFAAAAALSVLPQQADAQGVFRGAEQGGRQGYNEGGRAAGPVGAVVGGAIGTGVGAAVGGVKGVLGIPEGGTRRCRGYYTRAGNFRCYR